MYNGKPLIAFLGQICSLKWFKYEKITIKKTISFNNISSKRLYNSLNNYDNNNCNNDRSVVATKIIEDFIKDKNFCAVRSLPTFAEKDLSNMRKI